MPEDPIRDPLFRDPVIDGPYRPVGRESGGGWVAAILGILVVLALIVYFVTPTSKLDRTASNTSVNNTITTEKVVPPAEPGKPAMQPTQTQPTQPQQ